MQTITIDNALFADAQVYAADRGMSVTALIEGYLKRVVRASAAAKEKEAILQDIDHALKNFKLIQEGKQKTRPAEELLNEL